jgi:lipopolysaccharide/colanic/teichoic acid biosynthesis glycosyltransferase
MKKKFYLSPVQALGKRVFDFCVSLLGLGLTFWIILPAWLLATVDTRKNGFFMQDRVGRNGKTFKVIKVRTMRPVQGVETVVTTDQDPRITRLGRFWRKTKIDELPQLINVLKGDMSFVGPRPDVPGFADRLVGGERLILSIRPGITGPATLKYRDEEQILMGVDDPEAYNREVIFPDKVRINLEYIRKYSFWKDLKYIWVTVFG